MLMNPLAFGAGMAGMVLVGALYRLLRGVRLNLMLVHREGARAAVGGREGRDQVVIPVTLEHRRSLSWRSIRERRWEESVDLVLADDEGRYADLAFTFHPWMHYLMQLGERPAGEGAQVKLNSRIVASGRRVRVVDGDRLEVGRRRYLVRVTGSTAEVDTALAGSI